jgi:hypothetical protein
LASIRTPASRQTGIPFANALHSITAQSHRAASQRSRSGGRSHKTGSGSGWGSQSVRDSAFPAPPAPGRPPIRPHAGRAAPHAPNQVFPSKFPRCPLFS